MSLTEIEKTSLAILDQLPKQNIIGGTYEEIRDGFKSMTSAEKLSYAISLAEIYARHLEREFKVHSVLGLLDGFDTKESKQIASAIRADKKDAFKDAGEYLSKQSVKDKVVDKRNQKIESILSKGDKIDR
jgi:hypothetical protein